MSAPCSTALAPAVLPVQMAVLLATVLAGSGCVDRLITEGRCGDGVLRPGELCLGEGQRSELGIDTITPLSLVTGDFDGDQRADLMVLGTEPSGIVAARLFRGDGQGDFGAPTDPGIFGCSAFPVPGSLDDDGITDLLVDDCGPSVSLFRGTSSGEFETPLPVATGVATRGSGLQDLDADGQREVVVLGRLDDGRPVLSVAERDPTGTFAPPVLSPIDGLPDFDPGGFGPIDLDGDGTLDILVSQGDRPDALAIADGQGQLRFGPLRDVTPPGLAVSWAGPRDLDDDGRPEVLVGSYVDQLITVLEVRDGALVQRARTSVPGLEPSPIALGDVDGDGNLDIVRARVGDATLQAWLGSDGGRFTGPTDIELDAPVDQLVLVDLDDDGALDIVAGSFLEARIRVLLSAP